MLFEVRAIVEPLEEALADIRGGLERNLPLELEREIQAIFDEPRAFVDLEIERGFLICYPSDRLVALRARLRTQGFI